MREPRPDEFWTADLVEAWLVEMWDTDRRLDGGQLGPGSFKTLWPDVLPDPQLAFGYSKAAVPLGPATAVRGRLTPAPRPTAPGGGSRRASGTTTWSSSN